MPPIGGEFTRIPVLSPEQLRVITQREIEIGRRIDALAPALESLPIKGDSSVATVSARASYKLEGDGSEDGDRRVSAFVSRGADGIPRLETELYERVLVLDDDHVAAYEDKIDEGPSVTVYPENYGKGGLLYSRGRGQHGSLANKPTTFEQYSDTFLSIEETLALIEDENILAYGTARFR